MPRPKTANKIQGVARSADSCGWRNRIGHRWHHVYGHPHNVLAVRLKGYLETEVPQ